MKRLIDRLLRRREPERPATASEIEAMSDPLIEWQSEKWWYQQQLHLTRRVEFLTRCIAGMTLCGHRGNVHQRRYRLPQLREGVSTESAVAVTASPYPKESSQRDVQVLR